MKIEDYIDIKYNDEWKIEYFKKRFLCEDLSGFLQAEKFKKEHLPKLYKYSGFDSNHFLNGYHLKMNNPNKYDDPFDSAFTVRIEWEELYKSYKEVFDDPKIEFDTFKQEIQKNSDFYSQFSKSLFEQVDKERDTIWVTCFCESYKSMLMWSLYAEKHKGFCFEYDFRDDQYSNLLYPVFYVKKPICISDDCAKLFTISKSVDWYIEKEWRIIIPENYSSFYPPIAIYLGAKMNERNKDFLKNYAVQNRIESVYEMFLSPVEYEVIPRKIDL